ncbi:MAG: hypothetical protein WCL44_12820 [bacterium]
MYDQPNIGKPEQDFADPIGRFSDIFFTDIDVVGINRSDYYDKSSDGVFDICADVDVMSIRNIRFTYTPGVAEMAPYLVSVGPKAWTLPRGPAPQAGWKDVFNPDANPVVAKLRIGDVLLPDPTVPGAYVPCSDVTRLVNVRKLSLNPDLPQTMPRGGTGCGRVVDLLHD